VFDLCLDGNIDQEELSSEHALELSSRAGTELLPRRKNLLFFFTLPFLSACEITQPHSGRTHSSGAFDEFSRKNKCCPRSSTNTCKPAQHGEQINGKEKAVFAPEDRNFSRLLMSDHDKNPLTFPCSVPFVHPRDSGCRPTSPKPCSYFRAECAGKWIGTDTVCLGMLWLALFVVAVIAHEQCLSPEMLQNLGIKYARCFDFLFWVLLLLSGSRRVLAGQPQPGRTRSGLIE